MLSTIELSIHRKGQNVSSLLIHVDCSHPSAEVWSGGTKTYGSGTPRQSQDFKVIWSGSQDGIVVASEGTTRRFDFVLVGRYDAEVEIGDFWKVDNQHFQIEWVAPDNGYEVKAGGSSYGSKPV